MANDDRTILAFDAVTTAADVLYDARIIGATFALRAGELALIRFDPHAPRSPLPDAAMGLAELSGGAVQILGQSWEALSPRASCRLRGRIGRLFGMQDAWVDHLDIDENVTLRLRHHTRRRLSVIDREANELSRAFGLPGLPTIRPATAEPRDLQRAACARMLMGSPQLLIIDEPASGLYSDVLAALMREVAVARRRHVAVLWISADPIVWTDDSIAPTFRGDAGEPGLALMDLAKTATLAGLTAG